MFSTKSFGGYLSRLRKREDMTQSELAERLGVTRQSVSNYERGDSFPDISILVIIAELFGVTLDELIGSGEPTHSEAELLRGIATGEENPVAESVSDIASLAPLLKPSVLSKLAENLGRQGIDISNIVELAEYLTDETVVSLLEYAKTGDISPELFAKPAPFLDERSKYSVFQNILDGKTDWRLIGVLLPYAEYMLSPMEAAVVEGALPWEALEKVRKGMEEITKRDNGDRK